MISAEKNDAAQAPQKGAIGAVVFLMIFILLWILAGVAAFITSIVCFGKSGTTAQHVVGLLLAFFFGPFYWIYYAVARDYCR